MKVIKVEIKTTEQIVHKEMDLSELPNSLLWQEFNKIKWITVDDVIKLIDDIGFKSGVRGAWQILFKQELKKTIEVKNDKIKKEKNQ